MKNEKYVKYVENEERAGKGVGTVLIIVGCLFIASEPFWTLLIGGALVAYGLMLIIL